MPNIYIETYGCQMNLNDSEIVSAILTDEGHEITADIDAADVIFLNTCSVRENAEDRILKRLENLNHYRKRNRRLVVGVLGCMAERLRQRLIGMRDIVSIVVGPDEYRRLPELIESAAAGEPGIAVKLSRTETYEDILPLRTDGVSAWLSIMRGCNNFCSYCVVPYTRGRERSRPAESLLDEVRLLAEKDYREFTLLGQNVNSYNCPASSMDFADLLDRAAGIAPSTRFRYTTSHPRDMSDRLIETMAARDNICNHIHLPVQSGSDHMLDAMNRGYSAGHYLGRIDKIREFMPKAAISTDIIAGYPGETEADHQATLDLIRSVRYDGAFMFKYSPREGTRAYKLEDDVPDEVKLRRLNEIIDIQNKIAAEINKSEKGRRHEILVEGPSKRNPDEWSGRTMTNKVVIFPNPAREYSRGDLVRVEIARSTSATLFGKII
ncbi:MAG: tRNA (N6-isopentenyl adenosine(37)-C2)-methylthiotransferase MiaB [Candidatus Kapaibacterium sp.]